MKSREEPGVQFVQEDSKARFAISRRDRTVHPRDSGAVEVIDGFPRVNWPVVRQAAAPYADHPAVGMLWTELAAQWLERPPWPPRGGLRSVRRGPPPVAQHQDAGAAAALGKLGDKAYSLQEKLLARPAAERGPGKHVVIVPADQSAYYDYVSYFWPDSDREYAKSGGMHIPRGYRHTVVLGKSDAPGRTLVHELAHEMVSQRRIPRWLNEGLAQFAEVLVPGLRPPLIDARQARLHRRYWGWFGTAHFWKGTSFNRVPSQRLSYQLANILFRNMAGHPKRRGQLSEFLATARRDDAGAAACQECFGCTLSDLAVEFLGGGRWSPPKEQEAAGEISSSG